MGKKKNEPPEEVLPVLKQALKDCRDAEERWLEQIASGDATISDELRDRLLAVPYSEPGAIDVTGTPLSPGHPATCKGNGDFREQGHSLCCDECDYLKQCCESEEWVKADASE